MSQPLDDFVARREAFAQQLEAMAQAVQPVATEQQVVQLRSAAQRARDGRFVVLLLGCFSSGKSTLLNALLGRPVLPVKVNPCTAILTEVVYGATPSVEVHHHDADTETLEVDTFIERYQLQTESEEDAGGELADRFGGVEKAVVRWPLPLLKNGVVLLDTPGLDDDPARTARTLSSLPHADAVIFTLSANRFLTELELKTLHRDLLPLGLTNLFFPTTMVDLLDLLTDDPVAALNQLKQTATEQLGELGRERLFPLDARGGLHARWDRNNEVSRVPDQAALDSTGLAAFETALETFLVEERGHAQLVHLEQTADRIRLELARQQQIDEATANTDLAELRRRQEELTPQFDRLDRIQRRLARTIDHFVRRTKHMVYADLRDVLAQAELELPDALASFELGTQAGLDLLTERGRKRVEASLALQLEAWLEERINRWHPTLQPKLDAALDGLREELAADAADFHAVSIGIVDAFTGSSLSLPNPRLVDAGPVDPVERWFSVAVGALLLSPGAVAAGWSEGYEGALKGAAGRLGVRLAIVGLGALLGPIGWAGLVLYAVTDAVLLFTTGDQKLKKVKDQLAVDLQGRLVAQADASRDAIERQIEVGLLPLRDALVQAAVDEANGVRQMLDQTVAAREHAAREAEDRQGLWIEALAAYDEARATPS